MITYTYIHSNTYIRIWQFPLKFLPPRNPPNPETQISRYLAEQIQIEIFVCTEQFEILELVDFGVVAFSVEAVIYKGKSHGKLHKIHTDV